MNSVLYQVNTSPCSRSYESFFYVLGREVSPLIFTEGKHRFFERLMQGKPNFDQRPIRTPKERDCKHCLYYNERKKKCTQNKCIVFDD